MIDLGAGPGFAALDLAEIVGRGGRVIAVERSRRFLDALETMARGRELANITTVEADIVDASFGEAVADASWCRWVLSFVRDPKAVVSHLSRALRPGAVAVFHEYLDYRTWRLAPRSLAFERFVVEVIESIRAGGGFIDSALALPTTLCDAGFDIVEFNPIIDVVPPSSAIWQWPAGFANLFFERLVATSQMSTGDALAARQALLAAQAEPRSLMITPMVLEIIARKR